MKLKLPSLHKFGFYLSHLPDYILPDWLLRYNPEPTLLQLTEEQKLYVENRVAQSNKLKSPFKLSPNSCGLRGLKLSKNTAYKFDLARALRGHGKTRPFDCVLGDVTTVPATPSFVKTRPIEGSHTNSVLLKLNTPRHFRFFPDPLSFHQKKTCITFRSRAHKQDRIKLVEKYHSNPNMDIGSSESHPVHGKGFLPQGEQLKSKFIISIEGVDVASNLKWILASNSLCIMKTPTMESWFLESNLIPGKHYIQANDDFSNLEEIIQPYLDTPSKAEEMLYNAHQYIGPFLNQKIEQLIGFLIVDKYFSLAAK